MASPKLFQGFPCPPYYLASLWLLYYMEICAGQTLTPSSAISLHCRNIKFWWNKVFTLLKLYIIINGGQKKFRSKNGEIAKIFDIIIRYVQYLLAPSLCALQIAAKVCVGVAMSAIIILALVSCPPNTETNRSSIWKAVIIPRSHLQGGKGSGDIWALSWFLQAQQSYFCESQSDCSSTIFV